MDLVNVLTARSVWLFPTEELNPRGLDLRPFLGAIREHYAFQKFPSGPEDTRPVSGGLEFMEGGFSYKEQMVALGALKIFSDGLVAETKHTTDASDALLQDVCKFAVDRFGLNFTEKMIRRRAYFSEVVVSTKINLEAIGETFRKIAVAISERMPGHTFVTSGLRFSVDPAVPSPSQIPNFVIERRGGVAFDQNRYFSQAPMTTSRHLHLLDEIAKLIGE